MKVLRCEGNEEEDFGVKLDDERNPFKKTSAKEKIQGKTQIKYHGYEKSSIFVKNFNLCTQKQLKQ